MKRSIVFKWFVLTVVLFFCIFFTMVLTQNYFFKKHYIQNKEDNLKKYVDEFKEFETDDNFEKISESYYREKNVWLSVLDEFGNLKGVDSYYIVVEIDGDKGNRLKIPMYSFSGEFSSDVFELIKLDDYVTIDAVDLGDELLPYQIQNNSAGIINLSIANKIHGPNVSEDYSQIKTSVLRGRVVEVNFSEDLNFPYSERLFINQILEFQSKLIKMEEGLIKDDEVISLVENFVEYRILISPIEMSGESAYVFSMTSLQPVDEAVSVMKQIYPYYLLVSFLILILLAFVFSKQMAKPLIKINQVTEKIANMDFTDSLSVNTEDEIGQLSKNINYLSNEMETYIGQLRLDLDKEKRLETTRKEFISGVSHELKTPLAVIKSCISILKDGISPEKTDHYFKAIEDKVNQMDKMIVNMLDLAKFQSGTYKPKMEKFKLEETIYEICGSLEDLIENKKIKFTIDAYPQEVVGHEGLIGRVISNFLTNAIDHTDEGKTISLWMKAEENGVSLSIENEGKYIDKMDMEKIWDQFYRADERILKSSTGLGLSISKEILDLHGVKYGVENTEKGVKFYFNMNI